MCFDKETQQQQHQQQQQEQEQQQQHKKATIHHFARARNRIRDLGHLAV